MSETETADQASEPLQPQHRKVIPSSTNNSMVQVNDPGNQVFEKLKSRSTLPTEVDESSEVEIIFVREDDDFKDDNDNLLSSPFISCAPDHQQEDEGNIELNTTRDNNDDDVENDVVRLTNDPDDDSSNDHEDDLNTPPPTRPTLDRRRELETDPSMPRMDELRRLPSKRLTHLNMPADMMKHPKSIVWRIRLVSGKIVERPVVQMTIIGMIIVNALLLGVATFDFVTEDPHMSLIFSEIDQAFLVVFTIEIFLQLVYRSLALFSDGWLVFDFVIVVASWSLDSIEVIRAFRIFRAFRLVARIKPLRDLVMAIAAVMPRMYAIALLLILIFYIFAVLFTELFRDLVLTADYFTRLDTSLFTCMELMTLEWSQIVREVMEQRSWGWAPFVAFITVTGFIVFNLVVAVVCDAVSVLDRNIKMEEMHKAGEETDKEKLDGAQKRIWDLEEEAHMMRKRQYELQLAVTSLTREIMSLHPYPQGPEQYTESGDDHTDHSSAAHEFVAQDVKLRPRVLDGDDSSQHQTAEDSDSCDSVSLDEQSLTSSYSIYSVETSGSSYTLSSSQRRSPKPVAARSFAPVLSRIDSTPKIDSPKSKDDDQSDLQWLANRRFSLYDRRPSTLPSPAWNQRRSTIASGPTTLRTRSRRGKRRMLGRSEKRKSEIIRSVSFAEELENFRRQRELDGGRSGGGGGAGTLPTPTAIGASAPAGMTDEPPHQHPSNSRSSLPSAPIRSILRHHSSGILHRMGAPAGLQSLRGGSEVTRQVRRSVSAYNDLDLRRALERGKDPIQLPTVSLDDASLDQRQQERSEQRKSGIIRSVSFEDELENFRRQRELDGGGAGTLPTPTANTGARAPAMADEPPHQHPSNCRSSLPSAPTRSILRHHSSRILHRIRPAGLQSLRGGSEDTRQVRRSVSSDNDLDLRSALERGTEPIPLPNELSQGVSLDDASFDQRQQEMLGGAALTDPPPPGGKPAQAWTPSLARNSPNSSPGTASPSVSILRNQSRPGSRLRSVSFEEGEMVAQVMGVRRSKSEGTKQDAPTEEAAVPKRPPPPPSSSP